MAELVKKTAFPKDPLQRADLLFFLSLLATRVPSARELIDHATDTFNKALLKAALGTRERWEALEMSAVKVELSTRAIHSPMIVQ